MRLEVAAVCAFVDVCGQIPVRGSVHAMLVAAGEVFEEILVCFTQAVWADVLASGNRVDGPEESREDEEARMVSVDGDLMRL